MKVKKAIIPAGGLGTHFLPATKAMAKETLPIVDKPIIQFVVEEALDSGIEDILIVTGREKRTIEDHFDANLELEVNLQDKEKMDLLKMVKKTENVHLHFIRQSRSKGLGHAVLQAKAFVGNEPFVVLLGDDLMVDQIPLTKQLMLDYEVTHCPTIAAMEVSPEDTSKYGIIDSVIEEKTGRYQVKKLVEKPLPEDSPCNFAIIGRYLLTPEIFPILERQKPSVDNEIQLMDAINHLKYGQKVYARAFKGKRYDVSDKFGYIKANVEYGLHHFEVAEALKDYLVRLSKEL
ncbi:UTP--glucose-1-phosphate uridylyltransferase GalU [Enterococcus ratti]|uniref:UTP--glucose-1-phosphate uridylyltransferase n=1 Tax=Enterococcus ratti TaxID=150033 RepID=A0A1L8WGY5_9ENTE|nr:UTP--glucose-1-phosphate uridylyltransferase GalU [Enterococcus ratti]OJG80276.1 UTP-glucose-1-phosphate uridylyltransferase [Enterococcus ratti]